MRASSAEPSRVRIRVSASRPALEEDIAGLLREVILGGAPSPFALVLAGGSTPFPAYARLGGFGIQVPSGFQLAFTDERHVPPHSARSNYHQMRPLIRALGLTDRRVLRIRTDLPRVEAASDYHHRLSGFLCQGGGIPLALLGLGADGHTCGLFSDQDLEDNPDRLAVPVRRPDGLHGISVTPRLLAAARRIVFMVAGESKRPVLERFAARPADTVAGRAVDAHPAVEVWTEPAAYAGGPTTPAPRRRCPGDSGSNP